MYNSLEGSLLQPLCFENVYTRLQNRTGYEGETEVESRRTIFSSDLEKEMLSTRE